MSEHIMGSVYEAQRLAKEVRRAIAAARWEIAEDTARLKRVLAVRDCTEDERRLAWNEQASQDLEDATCAINDVAEHLDDIRDEAR